jgi:hypothetical protein
MPASLLLLIRDDKDLENLKDLANYKTIPIVYGDDC